MLAEAKANGHDLPIELDSFSAAIMSGRPHAEVHLQFGRCDGASQGLDECPSCAAL
jgi:hypothetical protein